MAQQRPAAALPLYGRVVAAVEAMRADGDLAADDRQTLFAQWVDVYKSYAALQVDAGQVAEGFKLAELSKARTLLESAALRRATSRGCSAPPNSMKCRTTSAASPRWPTASL